MKNRFFKKGFNVILSLMLISSSSTLGIISPENVYAAAVPELLITEIMPNPSNEGLAGDPYEYVELYNNSNKPIRISDYKVIVDKSGSVTQTWDFKDNKLILPKSTMVVWFNSKYSNSKTWDDFIKHFEGTDNNFTDEKRLRFTALGLANTGTFNHTVYRKSNNSKVCIATYVGETDANIQDGTIHYRYPSNGINMEKVADNKKASPGTVTSDQLPPVESSDNILPVILHDKVSDYGKISAKVTDNNAVEGVTLYYRTNLKSDLNFVTMANSSEEPTLYEGIIPEREVEGAGWFEYYIEAYDGINLTKTVRYKVDIVDEEAPLIKDIVPKPGKNYVQVYNLDGTKNLRPTIAASYSDFSGVNKSSVKLYFNDVEVTEKATVTDTDVSFVPEEDLKLGNYSIKLEVSDNSLLANKATQTWSFEVTDNEEKYNIYFGQLHSHSSYSDGLGTPEQAYDHARYKGNADYFALTDHSNLLGDTTNYAVSKRTDYETSGEWKNIKQVADQKNVNDRFVAIAGYEMTWTEKSGGFGHMNTFNTNWYESALNPNMNLPNYYELLKQDPTSISQFNHPSDTWGDFDNFGYYSKEIDDRIPLIELKYAEHYSNYIRALDKGWHVGPASNQDNHEADWVTANDIRSVALAHRLTREDILDAIQKRRVYATLDKNLMLRYTANGEQMGTILSNPEKLSIHIEASDPDSSDRIIKASVISNAGIEVASKEFDGNDIVWDLELDAMYGYYFVDIRQADGQYAVSAPIWTGLPESVSISIIPEPNVSDNNNSTKVNAVITNNSDTQISNLKVEFFKDNLEQGNKIGEKYIKTLAPSERKSAFVSFFNSSLDGKVLVRVTNNESKMNAYLSSIIIPELIITEILPKSSPDIAGSASDEYEFIEVYNTTNKTINMKDYKIVYWAGNGSNNQKTYDITQNKFIEPGKTMIIWVKPVNSIKTISDYNEHYSTNLETGQYCEVIGSLDNDGSSKLVTIYRKTDNKLVTKAKYDDGLNIGMDSVRYESIVYKYPTDDGRMVSRIAANQIPTPGRLKEGQLNAGIETPSIEININTQEENFNLGSTQVVTAEIANNSPVAQSVCLISGLYDSDNRLVKFTKTSKTIVEGGNQQEISLEIDIPSSGVNKAIIFVWDGLDTMRPLITPRIISIR
jgi:hypothetical protein